MRSGKFLLSAAGLALLIGQVNPATAASLKGRYSFTGEGVCLVSTNGFTATLNPAAGSKVFSDSFNFVGVAIFNGDGIGSASGSGVAVTAPPTPAPPGLNFAPSASSYTFTNEFTYKLGAGEAITTELIPGTYLQRFLTGPRTGETMTIDKNSAAGYVSQNNTSIELATPTTTVETHRYSNNQVWPQICHRSRVLVLLPPT
jgi:hypothetical protein